MNKFKFGALSLSLGLLIVAPTARAETLLEKIAATVLADQFGIDTRDVVVLHERTGGSIYDLAPVYQTSHYCKATPDRVWALRQQGLGWGQVAHKLGMHPGTFNKLRNQGVFDRDRFWTTSYRTRFAVPDQQIVVLRQGGGSLEDILGAIIIGKLTKNSPQTVYDQFRTERSWATISDRYRAPLTDWRRVVVPVRTVYRIPAPVVVRVPTAPKAHHDNGVRDHGAGNGKGNSQGDKHRSTTTGHGNQGKGNSHSNKGFGNSGGGHGKGNSSAKGGGKGNGKGGGNPHGKGGGNGAGKSHGGGNGHGKGKGG